MHGNRRLKAAGVEVRRRRSWVLLALLLWGCASTADVQERARARRAELEASADELYQAMVAEADARDLPIARFDERDRRLTSEWLSDGTGGRRQVILAVLLHRGVLALRVRIADEVYDPGLESWVEVPRTEQLAASEDELVRAVYSRWQAGEF